ncbi:MAG TPA: prepilin-type N-terminal cleavage/methylation domain-containing protein [Candidatus Limnocylindrales bacterium]|nr:prepilin-type N-terminal cleavage/methylation domain-containing protein [Candidatus Limnocylindrales bacterium]
MAKGQTVGRRDEGGFTLIEILVVVGLIAVISVIAIPMSGNALANFRVSGDARSVSNSISVAKMRAAAKFSRTRLFVDLDGETFRIETWDKESGDWVAEGGSTALSSGVDFGYGIATEPPPDTQGTIGQAALCKDKDGDDIANSACILFNSRGIPVEDSTPGTSFPPTADDAIYLTNGTQLFAITVSATGMVRNWDATPAAEPGWRAN